MNRMLIPDVAIPSTMPARSAACEYRKRHGRVTASMITPALTSRSEAVPSAPSCPMRPTEAARPSCAEDIDTSAISAPARALGERVDGGGAEVCTHPSDRPATVHVHVAFTY